MTSKDLLDVAFVQKINREALECNSTLEQKWKQYKKEFEDLQTSLDEFPKVLSASILMPLGSKVFLRAQLCNTNEIFIRHGEYFTKQTAYEAKAVCRRHINRCDGMIANLSKEKQLLEENLCERHEISKVPEDLIEIMEPYDEEEMNTWRERHKQKVKEYKQQSTNENKKDKEYKQISNEQEKTNNDLIILKKAADDGWESLIEKIPDDSDDYSENESCDDEDVDDDYDEDEEDDDEDSKIEIVFTNDAPETTKNLKKRVSFNNNVQIKEFVSRPEEHFIRRKEEIIPEREHSQILVTETDEHIINDIVERVSETSLKNENRDEKEAEKITRPVSRFKANRNNKINIK